MGFVPQVPARRPTRTTSVISDGAQEESPTPKLPLKRPQRKTTSEMLDEILGNTSDELKEIQSMLSAKGARDSKDTSEEASHLTPTEAEQSDIHNDIENEIDEITNRKTDDILAELEEPHVQTMHTSDEEGFVVQQKPEGSQRTGTLGEPSAAFGSVEPPEKKVGKNSDTQES